MARNLIRGLKRPNFVEPLHSGSAHCNDHSAGAADERSASLASPLAASPRLVALEFLSDGVDDRFGRSAIISASAQESGTLPISFKRPQATDTMRADEPATAECSHGSWPSFAMQAWYQSVRSLPNSMSPETG